MKKTLIIILTFSFSTIFCQLKIDGSFSFQNDPAKKYSLYIPSGYKTNIPSKLMLGFHPFNTSRWNARSWRDTLITFAEENNLILVCPDGGIDGAVDDPIDMEFTTAVLDSMELWYNIDSKKMYVIGFSVGGKATYTYGLLESNRFGGYIPIGAAVNGTTEVNSIIHKAKDKAFFLIHGSNDSPGTRFFPIRAALINNDAILKDTLMPGVGHTIDFQNRNEILTMAFRWIDSVNCASVMTKIDEPIKTVSPYSIFPNNIKPGEWLTIQSNLNNTPFTLQLFDVNARLIQEKYFNKNISLKQNHYQIPNVIPGQYLLRMTDHKNNMHSYKIQIQ